MSEDKEVDRITPFVMEVTVIGNDFDTMLHSAKLEGAALMHKFEDEVYIAAHSQPRPHGRTRFRSHLDEPVEIESWAITVVVKAKNKEGENGEPPSED